MPATPQPQSRADLQAELRRLITDELNHQNTAERVRKVLESRDQSYLNLLDDLLPVGRVQGLLGATGKLLIGLLPPPNARPGGPFFLDHWSIDQEEPGVLSSLERLPQALLCIGAEINIRLGPEAGRYVVADSTSPTAPLSVSPDGYFRPGIGVNVPAEIIPAPGNGPSDKFTADFTVSLSGKTFGKYTNGQTVPATGKTAKEVILLAAIEAIYPTYAPAQLGFSQSAGEGEVGESVSNTLTATFYQGNAGALSALRVYRNGTLVPSGSGSSNPFSVTVQMVRSLTPSGLYAVADYAAGPRLNVTPNNTPDDRAYQVRNPNAPQAAEIGFQSNVVYFPGYYRIFYGPAAAVPAASAQVRALPQSQLTSAGNQFILNTGTTERRFVVDLPPGKIILLVEDLDNLGQVITDDYVGAAQSVSDPSGAAHDYTQYVKVQAVPYDLNHRHRITTN